MSGYIGANLIGFLGVLAILIGGCTGVIALGMFAIAIFERDFSLIKIKIKWLIVLLIAGFVLCFVGINMTFYADELNAKYYLESSFVE